MYVTIFDEITLKLHIFTDISKDDAITQMRDSNPYQVIVGL